MEPVAAGRPARSGRAVAADIRDCVAAGLDVVEVLGAGASPSCGVSTTVDLAGAGRAMARSDLSMVPPAVVNREVVAANATAAQGLFSRALQRRLARSGLEIRFVEHDLLDELGTTAVIGEGGGT